MFNSHGGYKGKGKEIVDYSVNINPLGVSELLLDRLEKDLLNLDKYPEIGGESTRKRLSGKLSIDEANLILGNGATELIYLYARALDMSSGKALIVEPTFTEYEKSVVVNGGCIEHFPYESDFKLDTAKLIKRLQTGDVRFLYICNPNNPTGTLLSAAELQNILEACDKRGITAFIDESFIEFSNAESSKRLVDRYMVFILRSITKIYGIPGIRIGYGIGHRDIVEKMNQKKEPWTINTLALLTMETYLEDEAYLMRTSEWYSEEKGRFFQELKSIEDIVVYDTDANFITFKLLRGNGSDIKGFLLEKGFYVRLCGDFYGMSDDYVRLAVRNRDENKRIAENIKLYLEERADAYE